MKKILALLIAFIAFGALHAQVPVRPDAFPPKPDVEQPKVLKMASSIDQMMEWDCYPTYDTYVALMQHYAQQFPNICRLDTIGTSIQGRLILCVKISDNVMQEEADEPEFFYSSTIHGDEVTGYYFMLRLIDTLLNSYGTSPDLTNMVNTIQIYINPNANPDGTYRSSNNTVSGSMRYNSRYVDLNRNYPDPFGSDPFENIQQENQAMIDYVSQHHFVLSANLHGGSEVMNYPWDSFESSERPIENRAWWIEVCKRYVDTCRLVDNTCFRDVISEGYIEGGDWYVISNGRQDYMNYYHNCNEITMEVSSSKTLSTDKLDKYWRVQRQSLINYIKEIYELTGTNAISKPESTAWRVYPNPTRRWVNIATESGVKTIDLGAYPTGLHILNIDNHPVKVIKL